MRVQRALAWLAIAFYAIGQLATFAHRAEVRHTRCAQHGELVEIRPVSVDTSRFTDRATLVARTDNSDFEADEHCAFAASSRPSIDARSSVTTHIAAPCSEATARATDAVHAPQLAPLSVAPKTSPPLALFAVLSQVGSFTHTDEVLVCVRPSLFSFLRSPAAPPWCTATSARCSIQPLTA